jgi:DNA-directed RNA polymerase subunit M/transcription elongation factor TFIIS
MKFCDNCQFMLYLKINSDNAGEDEGGLRYYCKSCGKEYDCDQNECVYYANYSNQLTELYIKNFISQYTTCDPTLPFIDNLDCPNDECVTNDKSKKTKKEVVYIRYDEDQMKYLYICRHCKTAWKNNGRNTEIINAE